MKKYVNNKGIGGYEFLTVVLVCLILASILLYIAISIGDKEKFQVFRYNAKTIGINAIQYDGQRKFDTVYLYEMINDGLVTEMKNSFSGDELCDIYDSKVEFTDSGKKVTLRCGNYLIYKQDITSENYNIYKITDWTSKKLTGDNVDVNKVYNAVLDDDEMLDDYYEMDLFIKLMMNKYGSQYYSIEAIKEDFNVIEKTVYRKRVLVD